ncbi:hypothetical protein OSTOST_20339 [Ostertagia ostertagi]
MKQLFMFRKGIMRVQRIHASLSLVNKTIRGTITADKSTLEVINSLQLHQVSLAKSCLSHMIKE